MNRREEIDTITNFYKSWNMGEAYVKAGYFDKAGNWKVYPQDALVIHSVLRLIEQEVQEDVRTVNRIYATINGFMKNRKLKK